MRIFRLRDRSCFFDFYDQTDPRCGGLVRRPTVVSINTTSPGGQLGSRPTLMPMPPAKRAQPAVECGAAGGTPD